MTCRQAGLWGFRVLVVAVLGLIGSAGGVVELVRGELLAGGTVQVMGGLRLTRPETIPEMRDVPLAPSPTSEAIGLVFRKTDRPVITCVT